MSESNCDYLIVGAGTAGCLMANRLSAGGRHRVMLLEAGGPDTYPWIHIPVGYLYCIDNPRTDWRYRTEPDAGLNGRPLVYPRGRTLGGCSSINGMIYMRGQARDYDAWAAATGEPEWGWERVLPDFVAHEDHHAHAGPHHGQGGEWRVEKQRLRWAALDAFAEAAVEAGIPASPDFNRGDNEGVGYFEVNQKRGWRWNTSKAFLRPARGRRNLELRTGVQVLRLLLEPHEGSAGGWRCTGAEVLEGGERRVLRAAREVILCAGAVGSPQLLQLSGIGPGALLQQHGIEPKQVLPGVGENLQDHLQIRAVFTVRGLLTLNTLANSGFGRFAMGLEYLLRRSGPMSMAPSQLGIFTKSRPDKAGPDLQFHVQPLSLPAFGQPLHDFPAVTASVCNLEPTSRGTVRIAGADPLAAPKIAPNYLSTDEDRRVAADSLRVARRIAEQPAFAQYVRSEYKPGKQYQSDDELARLAGDIATTIFHPVGTAKMGRADDPMAVVDPRLRVRGVSGLRVVDASVMPSITHGNTNSPTLMIAEKAARWISADAANA